MRIESLIIVIAYAGIILVGVVAICFSGWIYHFPRSKHKWEETETVTERLTPIGFDPATELRKRQDIDDTIARERKMHQAAIQIENNQKFDWALNNPDDARANRHLAEILNKITHELGYTNQMIWSLNFFRELKDDDIEAFEMTTRLAELEKEKESYEQTTNLILLAFARANALEVK